MKKIILFIAIAVLVLAAVAGAGYYFLVFPQRNHASVATTVSDQLFGWKFPIAKFPSTGSGGAIAYSSIRDPGGIPQGLPVRLRIPVISVNSAIEDALITPDGRMDVPAGSRNVAWFSLGPHPGKEGSAVIGGHFGISGGAPWVFYNLDKVKIGDLLYIENDKGETLTFQVRMIKSFDRNADATTVFTSKDSKAHLNLITCEGVWNQVNGTYPQRLVVFSDLVPSQAEVSNQVVSTNSINYFPRPLSIGSRGADVVVLQTILEKKGFLVMPAGTVKGLYGALTRNAVAKYQASVGLPSVGAFGPLTIAKMALEPAGSPNLPTTGIDAAVVIAINNEKKSISGPQTAVTYLGNLYATPIDGIVTSFLLLLVFFMAFKVVTLWRKN